MDFQRIITSNLLDTILLLITNFISKILFFHCKLKAETRWIKGFLCIRFTFFYYLFIASDIESKGKRDYSVNAHTNTVRCWNNNIYSLLSWGFVHSIHTTYFFSPHTKFAKKNIFFCYHSHHWLAHKCTETVKKEKRKRRHFQQNGTNLRTKFSFRIPSSVENCNFYEGPVRYVFVWIFTKCKLLMWKWFSLCDCNTPTP